MLQGEHSAILLTFIKLPSVIKIFVLTDYLPLDELLFSYSKTCVKQPLFQGEHSAELLTFIKLSFVIKLFVLSIFEWPFYTGFTVLSSFDYEVSK